MGGMEVHGRPRDMCRVLFLHQVHTRSHASRKTSRTKCDSENVVIESSSFPLSLCFDFSMTSSSLVLGLTLTLWEGAEQHPGAVYYVDADRLLYQGQLQPGRPEVRPRDGQAGHPRQDIAVRRLEGHGVHPPEQAGPQFFSVS